MTDNLTWSMEPEIIFKHNFVEALYKFNGRCVCMTFYSSKQIELILETWDERHQDWFMNVNDIYDGSIQENRDEAWIWLMFGLRYGIFNRNIKKKEVL